MRYPNARDELLPDALSLAVFNALRKRHSLDYAVVYGGQLRHDVYCLFQPISLFSKENKLSNGAAEIDFGSESSSIAHPARLNMLIFLN